MDALWHVQLLGGLRATSAEREVTRFRTAKTAGLFAYLAYYSDRSHPREVITEMLWPGLAPDAGRNSLSTALSSLRHQLEPPGVPMGGVLVADRLSVRLNAVAVMTDTRAFEASVASATRETTPSRRLRHWREAVKLYQGALLPGHYQDWVVGEQRRLEELLYQTLRALVRHLVSADRGDEAISYARLGVALDPLREDARYDLVRALAMQGQPAAALQQHREFVDLLERDLGCAPCPAMIRLGQALTRFRGEKGNGHVLEDWPASTAAARRPDRVGPALPEGPITFVVSPGTNRSANVNAGGHPGGAALTFVLAGRTVAGFAHPREAAAYAVHGEPHQALRSTCVALDTVDVDFPHIAPSTGLAGPGALADALETAFALLDAGHPGQVLCSEQTAGLIRRDLNSDLRICDLGHYRLHGMTVPAHVYQLEPANGASTEFAPIGASAAQLAPLPARLTRFFGREAEIAHLTAVLAPVGAADPGSGRLVTLLGPPGCGKTRLSIEAAAALLEQYRGSIAFAALSGISQPSLMSGAVRAALGIPASLTVAPLDQLAAALADRAFLLILDNAEHLIRDTDPDFDDAGPDRREDARTVVDALIERLPRLRVLVTSRRALGAVGETCVPVAPLPYPRSATDRGGDLESEAPAHLATFASVRLFTDRAQAVRPDFQITLANAAAVACLCEQLEGVPLSIELAAARSHAMTPTQLLTNLKHGLDLPAGHRWSVAPRHRSLRGAIAWSYELLPPEVQRFFCRLSVFRGGWTSEAAEAVCEEPLAMDYLALLTESSLVVAEEHPEAMRYGMLEMLREYAWELLGENDQEALRQEHAEHFAVLSERVEPHLEGLDPVPWLDRLELEIDNLRAALDWADSPIGDREVGFRLLAALERFWLLRDHEAEARQRSAGLLGQPFRATPAYARALVMASDLAWRCNHDGNARRWAAEGLDIARQIGHREVEALAMCALSRVLWITGEGEAARPVAEQALKIQSEIGDRRGEVRSWLLIAIWREGTDGSRAAYERAVEVARATGDLKLLANAQVMLGQLYVVQGDHQSAVAPLTECLASFRHLRDSWGTGTATMVLGRCILALGDDDRGCELIEEGNRICRSAINPWGLALGIGYLSESQRYTRNREAYRSLCVDGMRHSASFPYGRALLYLQLASSYGGEGRWREARENHRERLAILHEIQRPAECVAAIRACAHAERRLGEIGRSARLLAAADVLQRYDGRSPGPDVEAETDAERAELAAVLGDREFREEWGTGAALNLDAAVAFALCKTGSL